MDMYKWAFVGVGRLTRVACAQDMGLVAPQDMGVRISSRLGDFHVMKTSHHNFRCIEMLKHGLGGRGREEEGQEEEGQEEEEGRDPPCGPSEDFAGAPPVQSLYLGTVMRHATSCGFLRVKSVEKIVQMNESTINPPPPPRKKNPDEIIW